MSSLSAFLNKRVAIITTDGKYFIGKMEGYDNLTNLVLSETSERIINRSEESEIEEIGLFVIRGDLVSAVGLVDEELDNSIDWTKVHGDPLLKTKKTIR